ncbi:MAG: LysR family transcriptional regulator [Hyphomicrobiales bacterium]|nr:LysR family transcriptional regulator [Hyphomicrobiales bacterium]
MHFCMDWSSVNFDWNRARAFLVTAEEGSLSAAARALGTTQPTLGRQVDALEQELGIVLFQRVGRGLALTPAGLELLDHVRTMGEAASRVSITAFGRSQSIEGTVCISASETYAAMLLPPVIAKLRLAEPKISVEIIASHTTSDLRRREADIAIRNFRPTEPDLIAKKIREVPARLYATPQYIKKIGNPKHPKDLDSADFINISSGDIFMNTLNGLGFNLTKNSFPILSENYLVMWELVKQGLGIGILDGNIGDAEPLVRQVLPNLEPLIFPIWLVAHRELHTSQRIRMVFDLLATELAKS